MLASHSMGLEGKRQDNTHRYLGKIAELGKIGWFFFPFPKCIHNVSLFSI